MVRDLTDLLDLLGVLLIAAGVVFFVAQWVGLAALAAGGVVLIAGSWMADASRKKGDDS